MARRVGIGFVSGIPSSCSDVVLHSVTALLAYYDIHYINRDGNSILNLSLHGMNLDGTNYYLFKLLV